MRACQAFRAKGPALRFIASANTGAAGSSATSTSATIPSSTLENDIIVVYVSIGNSNSATPPTVTTPTDYTLIGSATASNTPSVDAEALQVYYKVAVAADAGATLTISHGSGNYRAIIIAIFRPLKQGTPTVSTGSVNTYGVTTTTSTASNPSNQTVTASSGASPLIVFGAYLNTSTRSFSPTQDAELTPSISNRHFRYKIYNAFPADVTVGATAGTNTTILLISFYLSIT